MDLAKFQITYGEVITNRIDQYDVFYDGNFLGLLRKHDWDGDFYYVQHGFVDDFATFSLEKWVEVKDIEEGARLLYLQYERRGMFEE